MKGNRTLFLKAGNIPMYQIQTTTGSKLNYLKNRKGGKTIMAMKKSVWDMILKVIIAVASAVAGVLGANAMNL